MSRRKQRDIDLFLVDALVAIEKIRIYVRDFSDGYALKCSGINWDATIRQLEIVGESLNNLLEDDYFSSLAPDYFRKVVNFRNEMAHGYFGIDSSEVWNVVTRKLPVLENDLLEIVQNSIDLSEALAAEISEYRKLQNVDIVKYLELVKTKAAS